MTTGNIDSDTASPERARIFLSYSRTDLEHARPVINLLENAGFDVWWDGLLEGGEHYLPTTEAALEGADCVVVLWSKTSVDSNWVRDEAQSGRERGCLVPLSLDGTMAPLGFRQIQLLDVSAWKGKPSAPIADKIIGAVTAQVAGNGQKQTTSASQPISTDPALSRRTAIIGGLGLTGGLAVLGAWQFGLFGAATDQNDVSMAVLRFANLTGEESQAWFSDGLSNELRTVLARNPRLRVSAPTSSAAIGEEDDFAIGRALGVRNILRGSVQRVAETVRISAELVRIDDGLVQWAESYDRSFDDVLAVQTEIAETVGFALVTQVTSEEEARRSLEQQADIGGTENIAAYESYLRGHAFYELSSGEESDRAALAQFDDAIAADPNYALAHAMRATMLAGIANATSDAAEISSLYDRSITAAQKAIELEPNLGRGHLALGFALSNGKLDRKSAYQHYKSAQQLSAGDADTQRSVATFYAYGDQQKLATELIDEVLELDPLNARAFRSAGFIALFSRDYPKTIARMARALELNPKLASAQYAVGNAHYMQESFPAALAAFQAEPVPIFSQVGAAITHRKLDDNDAAQASFAEMLEQYGDAALYQQAQVQAQWGNIQESLTLLSRAFEAKDPGVLFAPNDPLLDPVRGSAEFDSLLLPFTS